jgi:hypothetical protein
MDRDGDDNGPQDRGQKRLENEDAPVNQEYDQSNAYRGVDGLLGRLDIDGYLRIFGHDNIFI